MIRTGNKKSVEKVWLEIEKTEVKSFSFPVILVYGGVQALLLSLASALGGGEWSASRLGRFYPPEGRVFDMY